MKLLWCVSYEIEEKIIKYVFRESVLGNEYLIFRFILYLRREFFINSVKNEFLIKMY